MNCLWSDDGDNTPGLSNGADDGFGEKLSEVDGEDPSEPEGDDRFSGEL